MMGKRKGAGLVASRLFSKSVGKTYFFAFLAGFFAAVLAAVVSAFAGACKHGAGKRVSATVNFD